MNRSLVECSAAKSTLVATINGMAAPSWRYAQTVRHLRLVQIYGRLWRRLHVPTPDLSPAPEVRKANGTWCDLPLRRTCMAGPMQFDFLNRRGEVAGPGDWNTPHQTKLWLYNLHYFDDLNAANRSGRGNWHAVLISRWIGENPPGHGNGWEAYPLSLRIVNWIKWALAGNALAANWVASLAVQARYLRRRLEWHLLGNHLVANAKALIFAGVFFSGPEAEEWLKTGLKILNRELAEQILSDGAHFELSPMYHSIIQEDLLDLMNLAQAYPDVISVERAETWIQLLGRMRAWLNGMVHPDQQIAFFNDAALGIAATPGDLEKYALRLGLPPCPIASQALAHHSASGYVRVALGPFTAFLDVARVGPDYLPGHAHADTLSFELSLGSARFLVNRGTSVYGEGPDRLEQRSTAAHNTVEVDHKNSSDVWGGFRVGRRARPFGLEIEETPQKVRVVCSHDGYLGLCRPVIHKREWVFSPKTISITDHLQGRFSNAISRFHLAPAVSVDAANQILSCEGRGLSYRAKGAASEMVPDTYHPQFGLSLPTQCLELTGLAPVSRTEFVLTPA